MLGIAGALGCGLTYGPIFGMVFLSTEHYQFNEEPASDLETPRQQKDSRLVTLVLTSLPEESPDAIRITWQKRTLWLAKSRITIKRTGAGYILIFPESLLELPEGM